MAISDVIDNNNKANAKTNTTAPEAKAKGGKNSGLEAFKASGAANRAQMTEDQKAVEGSKQDKIAFVAALGDPNRKQARVAGSVSLPSNVVVGYKFKALEDVDVPVENLKPNFKNLIDVEFSAETRHVKAGEEFHLNLVETADFISRLEYAGRFTGEGITVGISAKSSKDRPGEPLPILGKIGGGSIKEGMQFVADMVGVTEDSKGTPKIKPEYEDSFGVLYTKRSLSKKTAGAPKKSGEGQADIAAAFRALYAGRKN